MRSLFLFTDAPRQRRSVILTANPSLPAIRSWRVRKRCSSELLTLQPSLGFGRSFSLQVAYLSWAVRVTSSLNHTAHSMVGSLPFSHSRSSSNVAGKLFSRATTLGNRTCYWLSSARQRRPAFRKRCAHDQI